MLFLNDKFHITGSLTLIKQIILIPIEVELPGIKGKPCLESKISSSFL